MEYTLSLALEDFVPVILSSIGLYFIRQMVMKRDGTSSQLATLGWILITLGGLSKATWKLIMALTDATVDIRLLDNALFVFLAPGFVCMAWAMWRMRGGKGGVWGVPAGIISTFYILATITAVTNPGSRTWVFVLLGLTTLANLAFGILLIRQAWQTDKKPMAFLFLFNLVAIFVLSGLARIEPQTIPLQWTEQIINTFSQGAFAYAGWQLSQVGVTNGTS